MDIFIVNVKKLIKTSKRVEDFKGFNFLVNSDIRLYLFFIYKNCKVF